MELLDVNKIFIRCPKTLQWRYFEKPTEVLVARNLSEVEALVNRVEKLVNEKKWYAVGFVSYEASPAFNSDMITSNNSRFPLACFALFDDYLMVDQVDSYTIKETPLWRSSISVGNYMQNISSIKKLIERGDIYQINYTTQFKTNLENPKDFFCHFVTDEPYACYIETNQFQILSASPELFFELDGEKIQTRPMKGTAPRFDSLKLDNESRDQLLRSKKNKAENLMITDMMRNDLSKIAELGSVIVSDPFKVEKFSTVWQMTSTVSARTGASLLEILAAMFPCASITGAPKNKSMEYIKDFEKRTRDLYTGTIGMIEPGRKAVFSVAIRTAIRDAESGETVYGSGGGIVWDSKPVLEFKEVSYKARILKSVKLNDDFYLFETMRLHSKTGITLLTKHIMRLERAADYFGISFSEIATREFVENKIKALETDFDTRIKLTLDANGKLDLYYSPISKPFQTNQLVQFASTPVSANNIFLYHKSNIREVYDAAQREMPPLVEPILFNQESEVTETNISNIVYQKDGELFTPPVRCGLLPGIMRSHLLENKIIKERVIIKNDLLKVDRLFLINSLRGWRNAHFSKSSVTE